MTINDVARFTLIILLGFIALVTFLVAATIVGLMWADASTCNCIHYPIGLYALGFLGLLLFFSMISDAFYAPEIFQNWANNQREALIIAVIVIIAIFLLLI